MKKMKRWTYSNFVPGRRFEFVGTEFQVVRQEKDRGGMITGLRVLDGKGLEGFINFTDGELTDAITMHNGWTDPQIAKMKDLCERYNVSFIRDDYFMHDINGNWTPGFVEGWVGGDQGVNKTIFIAIEPDGSSHS
ncbi:hypothetical protein CJ179_38510 [Rhodococcus sp. ACS1]|uniref:hypothetical protein n=1 Tax=Rhodococcus sp. ACS1 TaxID=2028570 RepID=UPI000BB14051|nr:hypothetical protein [Rhodococcus sp. ACS1]PBC38493.1 hypothetical protein CJ179_38510 [Rhodococcus sp. ACS1]